MRLAFLIAIPLVVEAQAPATIRLDKPAASHPAEWTDVAGVFELANGKLVVLDARDRAIKLADMSTGTATMIGRRGPGPGEYELPIHMFGLPGDSAIVVDMANNGRPLVINSQGGISSYTLKLPPTPFISEESVVDARGRVYRTAMGYAAIGTTGLSGPAIERLDRRTGRIDTIGYVSRSAGGCAFSAAGSRGGGPPTTGEGRGTGQRRAYSALEQWAVAPDGRVAIVCPEPYRVLLIDSTGRRVEGPAIAYERVRVTDREKADWREARQQPVATMMINANRQVVGSYQRQPPPPEPDWPEFLPAFQAPRRLNGAAVFAPDGLLWVSRMVASGAPALYDIIGRNGTLQYRVTLPPRTRVVGFGNRGIYAVTTDDDDIQRLSRFTFPAMNNR